MSDPALQEVIAALWTKHEGLTRERVADLERALLAAEAGALSEEVRVAAVSDAHKLAGSLGTFGMPSASKAASQIELLLSDPPVDAPKAAHARKLFDMLRAGIEQRQSEV